MANKLKLEDWEWDMIAAGDAPADLQSAALSQPGVKQRLTESKLEELKLLTRLFRADCPTSLILGEWHLGLLAPDKHDQIATHLELCPHCQDELVGMIEAISTPYRHSGRSGPGVIRRIILRLESIMGTDPKRVAPAAALRGDAWSASYAGDDFFLSLTRQPHRNGTKLMGSIIFPPNMGYVALKQGQALLYESLQGSEEVHAYTLDPSQDKGVYQAPLNENATFTFDGIESGDFTLLITTPDTELVITNLNLEG